MKKMSLLVGIAIGIVIASAVGVTATVLYSASEIGFTPNNPNWHVDNLESAINDLYNGLNIFSSEEISNTSSSHNSLEFDPEDYKFIVITNTWYAPGENRYPSYLDSRLAISSITNATYIETGKDGHGAGNSSGMSRSYLIIPDGSGNDITITFAGNVDASSVYGLY